MTDGELVTVATFMEPMGAHILAGMLNDNGIPAAVFGENSSYIALNFTDTIQVKVNAGDYDAAMKLIEESQPEIDEEEIEGDEDK